MLKKQPKLTALPPEPTETQEQQQERLKRAVDGVQAALTENRAVINVTRLNLVEGRVVPEIQIQILK